VKRNRWQALLLVSPAAILLTIIFIVPLLQLIVYSFWGQLANSFLPDKTFTLENYVRVITDADLYYFGVYWRTVRLSLIATPIVLFLGYPLAQFVSRQRGTTKGFLMALIVIPLFAGIMIQTLGWVNMLSRDGVVNGLLNVLGIINSPIEFMGTELGILIALVQVKLPFMLLPLIASLSAIDPAMKEAARSLGANRMRTFLEITLPLSMPGAIAGTVLVGAGMLTVMIEPSTLGQGKIQVFGTLVFQQAVAALDLQFASAFTIMFVLTLAVAIVLLLIFSRVFKLLISSRRLS
jgi:putative spermidine/putrescine transport system permease protein